jgi:hypothetical protein
MIAKFATFLFIQSDQNAITFIYCLLWPKIGQKLLNNNSDSVCVYLHSTLNEAVNISGHIASKGWRTDELESI